MNFSSLKELKDRVTPALKLKAEELDITPDDIWNTLKDKWSKKEGLTLNEIVNDILNYKGK